MDLEPLREIGLTENEIKVYLDLLKAGSSTAYEIGKRTGIYRVHIYDKLEQLMTKGLVTHVYKGAKKYFQATPPEKIRQYIEDKKRVLEAQEQGVERIIPQLEALSNLPKEDTHVEVFKGREGLKYFLKDILKTKKEVLMSGIDDQKYQKELPVFIKQYFRDLKRFGITERILAAKKKDVIVSWGSPITAVMIKNSLIAETYRNHFEHLWEKVD